MYIQIYVVCRKNTPKITKVGKVEWSGLNTPGGLRLPRDGEGGWVRIKDAGITFQAHSGCSRQSCRVCKCSMQARIQSGVLLQHCRAEPTSRRGSGKPALRASRCR